MSNSASAEQSTAVTTDGLVFEDLTPEQINTILAKAAEVRADATRFEKYWNDPIGFSKEILGQKMLWRAQAAFLLDCAKLGQMGANKVALKSGHSIGKTNTAAILVLWWFYARRGRVITTAPTDHHVEGVLWAEIHKLRSRALVHLPASREGTTKLVIDNDWYALGLTTSKSSALQGRHHPRLLVVVDEASGVDEARHTEISTLTTDPNNCLAMIANPTETSGTFYEAFKTPHIWRCHTASCLEHPNVVEGQTIIEGAVSAGWVEERREVWGEEHPFWFSRVLGEFPKISNRGLIPLGAVERQTNLEGWKKQLAKEIIHRTPRVAGLDVARYGDNRTVLTVRRGDVVELQEWWPAAPTTDTVGRAMRAIKEYGVSMIVVDSAGVGAGVADMLIEQGANCLAYNGGHAAFTKDSYTNRRTEMWWYMRMRFEKGRIWLHPQMVANKENKLVRDLVAVQYSLNPGGRIKAQTKEDMLDNGIKSPDYADSLILSYAMDEDPEEQLREPVGAKQDERAYEEQVWEPIDPDAPQDMWGLGYGF